MSDESRFPYRKEITDDWENDRYPIYKPDTRIWQERKRLTKGAIEHPPRYTPVTRKYDYYTNNRAWAMKR